MKALQGTLPILLVNDFNRFSPEFSVFSYIINRKYNAQLHHQEKRGSASVTDEGQRNTGSREQICHDKEIQRSLDRNLRENAHTEDPALHIRRGGCNLCNLAEQIRKKEQDHADAKDSHFLAYNCQNIVVIRFGKTEFHKALAKPPAPEASGADRV